MLCRRVKTDSIDGNDDVFESKRVVGRISREFNGKNIKKAGGISMFKSNKCYNGGNRYAVRSWGWQVISEKGIKHLYDLNLLRNSNGCR